MPIRPHHRWLYPIDWPQLSAVIRFQRAGGRCECCRRPHGRLIAHLGDGRWWDEDAAVWRSGTGRRLSRVPALTCETVTLSTKVVLATAHLNHDPGDNRPANLKALCQRCHILHDRTEHLRQRQITYRKRRALGDLFEGTYF